MTRNSQVVKRLLSSAINISAADNENIVREINDICSHNAESYLADIHSDRDHNRSVVTLIGTAEGLIEAMSSIVTLAHEHIDLATHTGVHPRVGVVDVIPITPLESLSSYGADMQAAIDCAGRCLEWLQASELSIPIAYAYLAQDGTMHAHAGRQKARKTRGSHTLVGAREILVAFNIQLATEDVAVAQNIASHIRESSGGLSGVKALGFALAGQGCVQVSTNIERYMETSPYMVVQAVEQAALQYGVCIRDLELVGLAPDECLNELATLAYVLQSAQQPSLESHILHAARKVGLL